MHTLYLASKGRWCFLLLELKLDTCIMPQSSTSEQFMALWSQQRLSGIWNEPQKPLEILRRSSSWINWSPHIQTARSYLFCFFKWFNQDSDAPKLKIATYIPASRLHNPQIAEEWHSTSLRRSLTQMKKVTEM